MPGILADGRDDDERNEQIAQVLGDCMRRRAAGESVSDDSVIRANPSLMPELGEQLKKLRLIEEAGRQAQQLGGGGPEPGSNDGSGGPEDRPVGVIHYFGDYVLERRIGQGAMGVVYRARQVSLPRVVALKMMREDRLATPEDKERFHIETQAAASLNHPGIVPLYEVGRHEGRHFFAMAYIDGRSLAEMVRGGPLPQRDAARYMKKIAEAIQYAHEQRVIHRDIKPANVLIDRARDEPHVTDFGLSKQLESESGVTGTGQAMGTPGYMPPEQCRADHDALAPTADVYALGATLYCLLTGRPPFQAESVAATMIQSLQNDPVPPRQLNADIDRDLETICLKCLEKPPAKRYESANLLAEDLDRFLTGNPIKARPVGRAERLWRWCERNPIVATLLGTVIISLVCGTVVSTYFALESTRREKVAKRASELARLGTYNVQLLRVEQVLREEPSRAQQLLRDPQRCPEKLREFTWHLFDALSRPEVRRLRGNTGMAFKVLFASDGDNLLSIGQDGEVRLWDVPSGSLRGMLPGRDKAVAFREPVVDAQFSPDGKTVATLYKNGNVGIWDLSDRSEKYVLHSESAVCIAYSTDGAFVATAGKALETHWQLRSPEYQQGPLILWETATGKKARVLPQYCNIAAFAPDRDLLACGEIDQSVSLYDLGAEKPEARLIHEGGPRYSTAFMPVTSITFSPNGALIATYCPKAGPWVKLWDAKSARECCTLKGHSSSIVGVSFAPDSQVLATASEDGTIVLWDTDSGMQRVVLRSLTGSIQSIAFSPKSYELAVVDGHGEICLWDMGKHLAIADTACETLSIEACQILHFQLSPNGTCIAYTACGTQQMYAQPECEVALYDIRQRKRTTIVKSTTRPDRVSFSRDGKCLAYSLQAGDVYDSTLRYEIIVLDMDTKRRVAATAAPMLTGTCLALSPDGRMLACGGSLGLTGQVELWNCRTGKTIRKLREFSGYPEVITFSPDGLLLVFGTSEGSLLCWNTHSWEQLAEWKAHSASVSCLTFSPDGSFLASGGADKAIRMWEVGTFEQCLSILGHTAPVSSIAFSPDGRTLASGASQQMEPWTSDVVELRLWCAQTGQDRATLWGHRHAVIATLFGPDGHLLVTGDADAIRLWYAQHVPAVGSIPPALCDL